MPWKESSLMSSRLEFVMLALAPDVNMRALCRAHNISPKTGYKLLARYLEFGMEGLQDRSRRPLSSPNRSSPALEHEVLALHDAYPCWGPVKLAALLPEGSVRPHHNTIGAILRRHGRQVEGSPTRRDPAATRFEHAAPNILWQMDFKGHFALTDRAAGRCHPLTVMDDHSRYVVCLQAFRNETAVNVKTALTHSFRCYGLPQRITCDNGSVWRVPGHDSLSRTEVWLLRIGVPVSHSRPGHPQTQGKDERFHRTLKRELLDRRGFNSIGDCQIAFDKWRDEYNLIRPHHALGQKPPCTRYSVSARAFPERLPPVEYEQGDHVHRVRRNGEVYFRRRSIWLGEGLADEMVAFRPTQIDGVFQVVFCDWEIKRIDLRITD